MVECAWLHKQHADDTYLVRFFNKLAAKKDGKTAAAAGRKMLKTIYWMLKKGEKFRPQG